MPSAEYQRKWVEKNPDKVKIYRLRKNAARKGIKITPEESDRRKKIYHENRDQILLSNREKYAADENYRKSKLESRARYVEKYDVKTQAKNKAREAKLKVIDAYGGSCTCCGESHFNFLTIEHVNNDGHLDRKQHIVGIRLYTKIIKLGFPPEYTILCFNCNCAKGIHGFCPHQTNREIDNVVQGIINSKDVCCTINQV